MDIETAKKNLDRLLERKRAHEEAVIRKGDLQAEIGCVESAIKDYRDQVYRIEERITDLIEKQCNMITEQFNINIPPEVTPLDIQEAEMAVKNAN